MLRIKIRCIIHPTEDKNKVLKAIKNIFDGEIRLVKIDENKYEVQGYSEDLRSLEKLHNMVRIEQIITAVRSYIEKHTRGNRITLIIHKQAAYANKLSLIDSDRESPLGAIRIEIESDNINEIKDWLAPEIFTPIRKRKKHAGKTTRAQRKQLLKKTFK